MAVTRSPVGCVPSRTHRRATPVIPRHVTIACTSVGAGSSVASACRGYSPGVVPPAQPSRDTNALTSSSGRVDRHSHEDSDTWRGPHHTRSSHLLHRLGHWSSRAAAGVTVTCVLAAWAIVGLVTGFPTWWQVALYSTTSAVTVVMVFAIQHTQHREQMVTQRKLDELLRALPAADDRVIAAEAATDAELDDLIEMDTPRN